MHRQFTRRSFLRNVACGSAGLVILADSRSARGAQASEKLNVALVGVGGRGRWFVGAMPQMENVVALCDVNDRRAAEAYKRFPDLPKFHDFREMLDKMGRRIDAVVVATPDHTHAVASAAAIRAGKHVFTEKPLTRTVHESRVLRRLAKEHGVATSMGNQGTASGPFRRALELIRQGVIGVVKEAHVWNDQGGADRDEPPQGDQPVPDSLKWDLWLGPAALRPYHADWMKRNLWRDFGTANLGNWASHTSNLPFMALKVDSLWYADPASKPVIRVEAKASRVNRLSFPRWELVHWEIPARGDLPPFSFYWHNGSRRPGVRDDLKKLLGRELNWGPDNWSDWAGCLVVGTEGKIYANGHNTTFTMMPEEKFKDVQKAAPETVDRSQGHERDWLLACRGDKPAWASFDYAGPLTEFNMLGNVATQFEGPLEYDPVEGKITNHPEAHQALQGEYRKGWTL